MQVQTFPITHCQIQENTHVHWYSYIKFQQYILFQKYWNNKNTGIQSLMILLQHTQFKCIQFHNGSFIFSAIFKTENDTAIHDMYSFSTADIT